jgi:hypothetical protein
MQHCAAQQWRTSEPSDFGAILNRSAKLIEARSTESFRFDDFCFCRFAIFQILRFAILRFSIFADCLPRSLGPDGRSALTKKFSRERGRSGCHRPAHRRTCVPFTAETSCCMWDVLADLDDT